MDRRFQAFILVAENLSMSKAAELAFVSHQCISDHIRSLEQEYDVQLFRRKPRLALTTEGRGLLETLYEIRMLENKIQGTLSGKNKKMVGKVTVGIPMSRYTLLVPMVITAFKAEYPNVDICVVSNFSQSLEYELEHGTVDIAVTVQQEAGKNVVKAYSKEEQFLLLATPKLLRQVYGNSYEEHMDTLIKGVNLRELSKFPLIMYPPTSRLRTAMDYYAKKNGIQFQNVFESNRIESFHELTIGLTVGSMIPQMMYSIAKKANISAPEEDYAYAFPIDFSPLELPFNITLLYHKSAYMPEYKQAALQVIADIIDKIA